MADVPLNYAGAGPSSRRLNWPTHIAASLVVFLAWAMFVAGPWFVFPRFQRIFADFKAELPPLTRSILSVSDWFIQSHGWAWSLAAVMLIPVVAIFIDAKSPDGRPARAFVRWSLRVMFLLMFLYAVLVGVGLFVAIAALTESLSQ